jgi:hypothetical protein
MAFVEAEGDAEYVIGLREGVEKGEYVIGVREPLSV